MSSENQSRFPPPIRTGTDGSHKSHSSGALSPGSETLSPTSTHYARGANPAASPTETKFFDVISRVRVSRSRSRSRAGKSRSRSRSPMVLPPDQFPATSSNQPMSPTQEQQRPQQPRHASSASQGSAISPTTRAVRPSPPGGPPRRTSSDHWRGRHSNSWLFNDFSVTDSTKNLFHLGRKS